MKNKSLVQGKVTSFINIMHSILLVIALISTSIVFVLNFKPLYYFDINFLDIPNRSGMNVDEIKENYNALIDYNSVFYKDELEFPTLPMSETGKIHFEEVKNIFVLLQITSIITSVSGVITSIYKIKKEEYNFLKFASILSILIPISIGLLIALNWNYTFIMFHKIFFRNDYWIFDSTTDPVINILPDAFFMHSAILIVTLILIGAVGYYILYKKFIKS